MLEAIEGASFRGETVRLDGRSFVSCTFQDCRLAYDGGSTELDGCSFEACSFLPADAAASGEPHAEGGELASRSGGARQLRAGRWLATYGEVALIAIVGVALLVTLVLQRSSG